MHTHLLILLLIGIFADALGQNLVPNPSFEDFPRCPGSYSRTKSEFRMNAWYAANEGTPDAYNACASGEGGVPYNWAGVSEAYDGKGYAGIYLWLGLREFREYVQCSLSAPLISDTTYIVSFRFRLSSYSRYVCDRIGLHLSDSALSSRHDRAWNIRPTLSVIADSVLTIRTGLWETGEMEYRAKGGEQFVTIGNFDGDENTGTYKIMHRPDQEDMVKDAAYYYIDDVSVRMKYDPTVPVLPIAAFRIDKLQLGQRYILDNILFDFNSYKLLSRSFDQLEELVRVMQRNRDCIVEVSGHTDDVGSENFNQRLSVRRAGSVASYLISRGIAEGRIITRGFGKAMPLVQGESEEVRKANRRVEIRFLKQ